MNSDTTMRKIDKKAINVWRIAGWITITVYMAMMIALYFLTIEFDWPRWIVIVATLLTLFTIPLELVILPRLKYKTWSYLISEHEIELHHGIFFRKRTLIPFVRIQHVDAKQGPILRRYGLSTVTFSTAAGSHEIPALSEHTAEQVRRKIATIARITDEAI